MQRSLALGLFASALLVTASRAENPPNILFIFSDDHALNAISAYGGPLKDLAPTPNIDRLAREGMLFTRSYCSNSICGPSRAVILTGKHSHLNGFVDNDNSRFDGSQATFPKLLRQHGYQTSLIGKWHLISQPTGFDHWEILPGQGNYYQPDFISAGGTRRENGYCTDLITDKAIDWLKNRRDPSKPFLLMCQHKAPHRNWTPAPRHLKLFENTSFPEPATLFDDYSHRSAALARQKMTIARDFFWAHDMKFKGPNQAPEFFTSGQPNGEYQRMTPGQRETWDAAYEPENRKFLEDLEAGKLDAKAVTRWKYQRYLRDYLRTVHAVDESVGRILQYLDDNGLAGNTIVVYSSDQGFYLGEHGWFDKRWMFEPSFAMPLLVRWPGVTPAGSKQSALVQNIDYAPTFLEAAGVAVPSSIQGKSLLPLLKGQSPAGWRDSLYYFYSGETTHTVAAHDGIRTSTHKLIHFTKSDEWNLFDLEKDPDELRSLHDDPACADILASLKERYRQMRAEYRMSEATLPDHRLKEPWWKSRHQQKSLLAREGKHPVVFIGDSITQGWEGAGKEVWQKYYESRNFLNLGFSGDRTEHVLWRLLNGGIDGVRPKLFVLMIGTNNTGHRQDAPEKTAEGIKLILELLQDRHPEAKILLLSVFPRDEKPDGKLRLINNAINEKIRAFADGKSIHWLDLTSTFLDPQGILPKSVMPDFLHPQAGGYQLWADAMEPKIRELLGEKP